MLRKFAGILTLTALAVALYGCGGGADSELEKQSEANKRPVTTDKPAPAVPGSNTHLNKDQGGGAKPAGTSSSGG
jgi:hypothetical protein